jgi:hypothetical protein
MKNGASLRRPKCDRDKERVAAFTLAGKQLYSLSASRQPDLQSYEDPIKDPPHDPPNERPLIDPVPPDRDLPRMSHLVVHDIESLYSHETFS